MSVGARSDEIVAELSAAGLRATNDPARFLSILPAVLVQPPSLLPVGNFQSCISYQAQWTLIVAAKGSDSLTNFRRIVDEMLPKVYGLYGPVITGSDPDSLDVAENTESPAYRVTFQEVVT